MFLSLVDFESIQSGKLDTANLIDVIGQVFELGDLETVQCHGKQRKKIEFSLRDISDQKIPCCLWGKFAEAIHSFSQQAEEEIVVCLIRFAKIGTYRNKAKGKQPQCSKRFRANGGDYNNKSAQFSNIISRRSSCLKIQPTNLLPAFSKADIAKQQNSKVWTTSQHNETEDELDITAVTHNLYEEGDDYSDQSYDVSSEDSDSYEITTGNTEKKNWKKFCTR
ncbi:hypothetical protein F2Q69_00033646 [Brassica cretica]|uniref:Replication protein A OB domain-containing protein n=1 Tax=Brassica cretica TaxID=69181 RepID=A0A8S9ST97_BRACR|nr:hypothetical protein F2Q69_00033646 [Brassica cretica]